MSTTDPAPKPTGLATFRKDLCRSWTRITQRTSITHTRFVLLLVLFGTGLRIARMLEPVSHDEAMTWTHYASQPFGLLFSNYTSTNNHVLHSLLVKLSTGVFGVHLWSLRLPALLAGILVMPLFYAFVRAMFNRYIALITLAFVASSGPLIEYSALARGYSLAWLAMVCALLAGRHYVKKENVVSLFLVAVFCAFCLWAVPSSSHAVVMVYVWIFLYLGTTYRSTLQRRALRLAASFVACLLIALLLYAPLIGKHGIEHLFHHPSLGDISWKRFVDTEQDQAYALWGYFNDTAATWISLLGIFGVVYAAYTSSKYRLLLFALLIGTIPLVLIQRLVAPPRAWTYVLFILHLASGISLFYLLKLLQERVYEGFTKRGRTAVAAIVVAGGMGWLAMTGPQEEPERFPDAQKAAKWFTTAMRPGDRVWAQSPWVDPLLFHLACEDMGPIVGGMPAPGGRIFAIVGPGDGQTLSTVLMDNGVRDTAMVPLRKVEDWRRLEIFAPR